MMRWATLLALIWTGTTVSAETDPVIDAWRGWMAENAVTASSIAIAKDGEVLRAEGVGRDADVVVPVASLSKAITGACVMALVDEGAFGLETPLGKILKERPDILGNGADITVAQLLTHTSGLDFDRTQSLMNPSLWGAGDLQDRIATLALERSLGPPEFFYNNENYAVLGAIITQATGLGVESACRPRVLAGLDSAGVDPRIGGGLAWQGWSISMADYALFAARLEIRDDWPRVNLGSSADYGPGVFVRETEDIQSLWHFGALCALGFGDFGAFFFVIDDTWSIAVQYDICANNDQLLGLNAALVNAILQSDG